MSLHHIIPKFILRGFVYNPNENKNNHAITIYDTINNKVYNEFINRAYAIENFNSEQTEEYLCKEFENKIARIFQRIKKCAESNKKDVVLSNEEYKLLFRFFTIMWRRNDIQLKKGKELFINIMPEFEQKLESISGKNIKQMLKDEYKNLSPEELFKSQEKNFRIVLYDTLIKQTTDNDETVRKTILNYYPCIINNNSQINFLLHNTYATNLYKKGKDKKEFAYLMLCPITNKLCFCLSYTDEQININQPNYKIPIDIYEDNITLENLIKSYITKTSTSFVVDKTNYNLLKEELNDCY